MIYTTCPVSLEGAKAFRVLDSTVFSGGEVNAILSGGFVYKIEEGRVLFFDDAKNGYFGLSTDEVVVLTSRHRQFIIDASVAGLLFENVQNAVI